MAIISNHPPKPVTFHNIVFAPNLASEKPYNINILKIPASAGVPTTNITYAAHRTLVSDIRGYEDKLSLEEDGFMYAPYISDVVPTYERASISAYSNAMVELLGKYVEAEKIFCYDMRLRQNSDAAKAAKSLGSMLPDAPIERPHMDHSREGGWHKAANHLDPIEQEKYLDGSWRVQIWNIWRPLKSTVVDMPLALCDRGTVSEADLLHTDQVGPVHNNEIYFMLANDKQKWYWLSNQTSSEACIFLAWDSHPPGGKINFLAHASFRDPDASMNAPPRESIEARLMTFSRLEDAD